VASKMQADPADGKRVMTAIQDIADRATGLLTSTDLPRKQLISGLSVSLRRTHQTTLLVKFSLCLFQSLIDENHDHLSHLGVSHPALELIRARTGASPHNLSTKLTGAGGGGCAVTLIPDGKPDLSSSKHVRLLMIRHFLNRNA
jgi:mevalonate kinase